MDDEQARRVGLNEAVFRQVNERLEGFAGRDEGDLLDLVCECADLRCAEHLRVERGDYENARAVSRQFLVAAGHGLPGVEQVIQKHAGWDLIEKVAGVPGQVAEETDPRA